MNRLSRVGIAAALVLASLWAGGVAQAVEGRPGAPLQPTVVAKNGSATVTVAAGLTGGTPTSFWVEPSPRTGGAKACGVTGASGSCTVFGLTNGQAYTFTARASNATGKSEKSVASLSVTPLGSPVFTLSSNSEAATQGVAMTGFTSISTGGVIATFSITPAAPTGTVFSSVTGALSGTPSATQRPTSYKITATNASGLRDQFFMLEVKPVIPGAPAQPTVVAKSTSVTVTVAAGTGGTPSSYSVSASPQVSGATKGCSVFGASGICTVFGLTNGVAYTFTATASNASGTSGASIASVSATPAPLSCALGGPCVLGETGRGGGIVFYVSATPFSSPGSDCDRNGASVCKYLEAAPVVQSTGLVWATTAAACYNADSVSSTNDCQSNSIYSGTAAEQAASEIASEAFGMGMSNTNQIYARLTTAGGASTSSYAAGMAWAYSNNSKTDWFLPSRLELNQLCRYAWSLTQDNTATTCTGGTTILSPFVSAGRYWMSTENGLINGTGHWFGGTTHLPYRKNTTRYVHAVRAF